MLSNVGPAQVLEGLKHYFLLDRGDLLAAFLDTAEAELAKPAVDISVPRLQSLLELGTVLFSELSPLHHSTTPSPFSPYCSPTSAYECLSASLLCQ